MIFLAKRFVAGETMGDAIKVVNRLNSQGLRVSLDILGEDVSGQAEAIRSAQAYHLLLREIQAQQLDCNVSLKLSQMGLNIGDDFCFEQVKSIVACARETHGWVRLDMEGSRLTERTLQIFTHLRHGYPQQVGIVIQAYLHRSIKDVEQLCACQAAIRLCKGAYKEPTHLALQDMREIRQQFMRLVSQIVTSDSPLAIATHDRSLITQVQQCLVDQGLSKDRVEFQFLFGLRRKLSQQLVQQGYQVRIYVPYGTHWLPYFSRRLRERKENVLFVLRNLWTD